MVSSNRFGFESFIFHRPLKQTSLASRLFQIASFNAPQMTADTELNIPASTLEPTMCVRAESRGFLLRGPPLRSVTLTSWLRRLRRNWAYWLASTILTRWVSSLQIRMLALFQGPKPVTARMKTRRQWIYGTISSCQSRQLIYQLVFVTMVTYHLTVALDERTAIIQCLVHMWMTLYLFCLACDSLTNIALYCFTASRCAKDTNVSSDCLSGPGKPRHWNSVFTTKQMKNILVESFLVDGWA